MVFLNNPRINLVKIFSLFLIYGPITFIKFTLAYLYWNKFHNGRVRHLFASENIDCFRFSNDQMSLVENFVIHSKPDLILSVNCNALLPNSILKCARLGGINLHQGSVPLYRGLMPIFYSQINNETTAGSTVHCINSKFDCGDILVQEKILINPGDNYVQIWDRLNDIGSKNLISVLEYISTFNQLPPSEPQMGKSGYYSIPNLKLVFIYCYQQYIFKIKRFFNKFNLL